MTSHMAEHTTLLQVRQAREDLADSKWSCPRGVLGAGHFVRSDNPMRTGRCDNCHAFVGLTRRGWKRITRRQAIRWGLMGVRR